MKFASQKLMSLPALLGLALAGCSDASIESMATNSSIFPVAAATPSVSSSAVSSSGSSMAADGGKSSPSSSTPNSSPIVVPRPTLAERMVEWKLLPNDIKDEWQKAAGIVRTKTPPPGAPTGQIENETLVRAITDKFRTDPALAEFNLNIDANRGVVTLRGSVRTLDQMGRAIAVALETEGADKTVSLVTLTQPTP